MARGINKVTLIGNIGKDPVVKTMPSGKMVANISVATSESWKDKTSGETVEETEWHRVVLFDKLAEIVEKYCKGGQKVYIEGRNKTRKWTDKDGIDRYTTEVIAKDFQMIGGKDSLNSATTSADMQPGSDASRTDTSGSKPDFYDDIPF